METVADYERKRSSHEVLLLGFFDKLEVSLQALKWTCRNIHGWHRTASRNHTITFTVA